MTAPVDELAERLRPWVSEAVYDFAELVALARLAEQSNGRYYRKWARAQTKAEQYREALERTTDALRECADCVCIHPTRCRRCYALAEARAALATSEGGEQS